jgi:hypothetical protein
MKKTLLTLALAVATVSVMAQGSVNFTTVSGSLLRSPVYGPELGNQTLSKSGNNATGIPQGAQVYTGSLLAGSGYTAQLWAAAGAGQAEGSLVAALGATTSFRTGTAAGFVANITGVLTGVPLDAPSATLQLRVWDNQGGTITSWGQALTAFAFSGKSTLFTVNSIGGNLNPPPFLEGIQSFNIYAVPEPGTFVLAGLAAASLLIFRRRK